MDRRFCHLSLGLKTDSSAEEIEPLVSIITVLKKFHSLNSLVKSVWTISVMKIDAAFESRAASLTGNLVDSFLLILCLQRSWNTLSTWRDPWDRRRAPVYPWLSSPVVHGTHSLPSFVLS